MKDCNKTKTETNMSYLIQRTQVFYFTENRANMYFVLTIVQMPGVSELKLDKTQ